MICMIKMRRRQWRGASTSDLINGVGTYDPLVHFITLLIIIIIIFCRHFGGPSLNLPLAFAMDLGFTALLIN